MFVDQILSVLYVRGYSKTSLDTFDLEKNVVSLEMVYPRVKYRYVLPCQIVIKSVYLGLKKDLKIDGNEKVVTNSPEKLQHILDTINPN